MTHEQWDTNKEMNDSEWIDFIDLLDSDKVLLEDNGTKEYLIVKRYTKEATND